jgi:hypothetical protein
MYYFHICGLSVKDFIVVMGVQLTSGKKKEQGRRGTLFF